MAKPALNENRAALRVPPIGDVPGMVLRYAQRGQRDFDAVDLDQLHEMIAVIDALMDARDAYVRGTANERARIVRDLHDDVSARLLTSLHREDPAMMRTDIREAMAEIRAIVFGGTGMHCLLEDVIAGHALRDEQPAGGTWHRAGLADRGPGLHHPYHRPGLGTPSDVDPAGDHQQRRAAFGCWVASRWRWPARVTAFRFALPMTGSVSTRYANGAMACSTPPAAPRCSAGKPFQIGPPRPEQCQPLISG